MFTKTVGFRHGDVYSIHALQRDYLAMRGVEQLVRCLLVPSLRIIPRFDDDYCLNGKSSSTRKSSGFDSSSTLAALSWKREKFLMLSMLMTRLCLHRHLAFRGKLYHRRGASSFRGNGSDFVFHSKATLPCLMLTFILNKGKEVQGLHEAVAEGRHVLD